MHGRDNASGSFRTEAAYSCGYNRPGLASGGWPTGSGVSSGCSHWGPTLPCRLRMPGKAGTKPRSFARSEEHTSELKSLMRITYAAFCLEKKKRTYETDRQ